MASQQPAQDRVSWYQLIAYGMGGVVPIALFNIAGQLMGLLGNISLGLSALWLGVIMIVPKLWDALSDPLIGHFSDNTHTRWGRRRPFILIGGIAVAVSFVAMWWVPRGEWIREVFPSESAYNWFQLVYILFGLLIFFTSCNLFEIPHGALGMEMSTDYHERTRLFSAKSFLGNFFALGTPWLLFFSEMEFFRGSSGDLVDGMRYLSLFIAAIMIPLSYWWFVSLKEPGFQEAKERPKTNFWADMAIAMSNKPFLFLVTAIFTLAMGFNFVSLFNYYITIFYLFGGDAGQATKLLGWGGTTWAITGLIAVFPLNWISRRIGKKRTLILAILIMCAAQLSKIVCYDPANPYLVLIPTALLSMGMLMFFTLGSSMVGDVCDEDELNTGTRREGTYYSVFWWFIKMGTAFASLVTGILLLYTQFDEKQNVQMDALLGNLATLSEGAEIWEVEASPQDLQKTVDREVQLLVDKTGQTWEFFNNKIEKFPDQAEHNRRLLAGAELLKAQVAELAERKSEYATAPKALHEQVASLKKVATYLKAQSPDTLFRLRFVEIGLPLLLSIISISFAAKYPLTEQRCHEIKEELAARKAVQNN
jgi:GPH family glycoside/pentoside/hexuronide:cation symporter